MILVRFVTAVYDLNIIRAQYLLPFFFPLTNR
jgi:hypothetical protein